MTIELTLTREETLALEEICQQDELSPAQAVAHIVRARLLSRPQFGRSDRTRLRICLKLLGDIEQHIGRATRPVAARGPTASVVAERADELLALGVHVRRVCQAIGESMMGNLEYWRPEQVSIATEIGNESDLPPELAR